MSWIAVAVGGGLAVGGGAMSAMASGQEERNQDWLANPEYPNSQDARDTWWQKLQDWGKDPNYGAISPDWDTIWAQTQQKVKQYYSGGPLNPGVKDRIKSSLARRGMSDNPASQFLEAQVGAQEAQDLGSLSAQQNIARNEFAESGRKTWLDSINTFQAQKPSGQWDIYTTDPGAQQKAWGNMISGVGSSVAGAGLDAWSQQKNLDFLKEQNKLYDRPMYGPMK